jgi:hypothetical protein
MKNKIALLTAIMTLSLNITAIAKPPKPAACPEVSNIASVGVDTLEPSSDFPNAWNVYNTNNKYNTQENWMLVIMDEVHANSKEQAQNTVNTALKTLQYEMGPTANEVGWACFYTGTAGEEGITAMTITPPQAIPSVRRMKR